MSKVRLSEDLRKYLTHRLRRVVDDSLDTALRANLNKGDAVAIVYVAFVHEIVMLALAAELGEAELTEAMRGHYRAMQREKENLIKGKEATG